VRTRFCCHSEEPQATRNLALPLITFRARFLAALKIVARASRPLSRGHLARAQERDAPATAGETPTPHPSTVGPFSWFPGARHPSHGHKKRYSNRGNELSYLLQINDLAVL
jgi:hypothetical protein